ncbi:hypothetical protein [uncultured Lamprocystis sp.]|uniref:hypothetical protein n=1 Tax=uncultured Lamprocystis sp. TaxID=543132 RepID=UPI0025D0B4B3|nr:hypothetical protein [uncultured Lamprocystis sp.]
MHKEYCVIWGLRTGALGQTRSRRERIAVDQRHWLLGAYAWGWRFESRLTTFGDQAMTIRRDLFAAVGGFPEWNWPAACAGAAASPSCRAR